MSAQPKLALIAALGRNRCIGVENRLPWHLPEDLKYFRDTTRDHAVIMGRKTFESIGQPLPQRLNVVISRNRDWSFHHPDVRTASSLEEAIEIASQAAQGKDRIFVIGGAEIYRLALPKADLLYLTQVDAAPEGDAFFPEWDPQKFKEVSRDERETSLRFTFTVLERA